MMEKESQPQYVFDFASLNFPGNYGIWLKFLSSLPTPQNLIDFEMYTYNQIIDAELKNYNARPDEYFYSTIFFDSEEDFVIFKLKFG